MALNVKVIEHNNYYKNTTIFIDLSSSIVNYSCQCLQYFCGVSLAVKLSSLCRTLVLAADCAPQKVSLLLTSN